MRYKIVCIRDRAADAYMPPSYVNSQGQAIRQFGDMINGGNNDISKHPEDFDLFYIGEFDDETGEFDTCRPQQIAVGKDLKV